MNFCVIWQWSFFLLSHNLWENGRSEADNFGCSSLGWTLCFWMFSKTFCAFHQMEGSRTRFAICDFGLGNQAALSKFRKHDDRLKTWHAWELTISISTYRLFFLLWEKMFSMICIPLTKFSWKAFCQPERWFQKLFCWNTKLPSSFFLSELRALLLWLRILMLDLLVTVIPWSLPSVLDNKGCQ